MTNDQWKMENALLLALMAALELLIPDPSLVLLVGPAGAGKSTFAARHFRPTEIVSSDRCRAMISDDESDQSVTAAAFGLLHHLARVRMEAGRLTVIDATNLQFKSRRPLLSMAHTYNFPLLAVVFNLSLETCLTRNLARPARFVSEEVIEQHTQDLALTLRRLEREGYERIYVLNEEEAAHAVIRRIHRRVDRQLSPPA